MEFLLRPVTIATLLIIAGLITLSIAAFRRTEARTARSPCDALDAKLFHPETHIQNKSKSNAFNALDRLPLLERSHNPADGLTLRTEVKKRSYRRGRTLVNFWSTTCNACLAQLDSLLQTARRWKNHGGTTVLVSTDKDISTLNRFFNMHPALLHPADNVLFAWDQEGKAASAFGTSKFPETYLLDENGKIILKVKGERDFNGTAARKCLLYTISD